MCRDGWCSRKEARDSYIPKTASVDQAMCWFDDKYVAKQSEADKVKYAPTEADSQKAIDAIARAKNFVRRH